MVLGGCGAVCRRMIGRLSGAKSLLNENPAYEEEWMMNVVKAG